MQDILPELASLLDGFTATGGGRTMQHVYLPWGRHWDQKRWAEIRTAGKSMVTVKPVSNVHVTSDIGGGAEQNRQLVDVHVWWWDDADLTSPDLFRRALLAAIAAVVHANEKATGAAWFTRISNVVDGTALLQAGGTGTVNHELIVTVEATAVDVYA